MKKFDLKQMVVIAFLVPACGEGMSPESAAADRTQAVSVATTTDVVNSILLAAQQLRAATANMNAVLAGAYSVWPSKAEFQRANTIRGYANDLDALNAVSNIAAAYAQGAYFNPSLNYQDRQQLGSAYAVNVGSAGAYVIGGSFSGAYVMPTGGVAGAYVAGAYSSNVMEKVSRVNRE